MCYTSKTILNSNINITVPEFFSSNIMYCSGYHLHTICVVKSVLFTKAGLKQIGPIAHI